MMQRFYLLALLFLCVPILADETFTPPRADGYRGIWYSNQPLKDNPYIYKYSGGLGTYCAKHHPHAVYSHAVNKTFFVYGGTKGLNEDKPLLIMIGEFDHSTGKVSKPAILMEKGTGDAHHNPVLSIDDNGYLWIFASAHGGKNGFIFKSAEPYSTERFQRIAQREFTYPQPWWLEGKGFVFLFTKYTAGRELYCSTSQDGLSWSEDKKLVGFGGHYTISWPRGNTITTASNWHPAPVGLNARTNLYVMQTKDQGKTWKTLGGETLNLPLDNPKNPALIHDYQADGLLVYLKNIAYDPSGNPAILYVTSKGFESGPEHGPRTWTIAHWQGDEWAYRRVTESDHNYDMGSLYIEDENKWTIIAPTEPGAQPYGTGGDIAVWRSADGGKTWSKERQLTHNSERNQTYVRRPLHAHPDFYAFWADGNALNPSESNLYFTNQKADTVWRLPETMTEDWQTPEKVE